MKSRNNSGNVLLLVCILLVLVLIFILIVANQVAKDASRQASNGTLLEDVYEGIVGNPGKSTFGYLGDMGDYPAGLMDLTTNPGVSTAWKGPYINTAPLDKGIMVDHYSAPLEYFVNFANATTDQITVISRGRDHGSTNTATNPNLDSLFAGTLPNSGTYGTSNPDNEVYPDFVTSTNNLYRENAGTITYDIQNFDQSSFSNTTTAGCAALYSLRITSVARGANDTTTLTYQSSLYAQSFTAQLLQGIYDVEITSQLSMGSIWRERITVLPGAALNRTVIAPRIDSNGDPTFTFTLFDDGTGAMEIWANGAQVSTDATGASTRSGSIKACSAVSITGNGKTPTYDTFIMPYGNFQRVVRTTNPASYTLTITNGGSNSDVIKVVYMGPPGGTSITGLVLGTVYKRHVRTFTLPGTTGANFPVANRGARIEYRRRDDTLITAVDYTANGSATQ